MSLWSWNLWFGSKLPCTWEGKYSEMGIQTNLFHSWTVSWYPNGQTLNLKVRAGVATFDFKQTGRGKSGELLGGGRSFGIDENCLDISWSASSQQSSSIQKIHPQQIQNEIDVFEQKWKE